MANGHISQFFQKDHLELIATNDLSDFQIALETIHAELRSLALSSNYLEHPSAEPDENVIQHIRATRKSILDLLSLDLNHPYGEQCTYETVADAILAKLQQDRDIQRVKNDIEPLSQLVRKTCNECAQTAQRSAYTPL